MRLLALALLLIVPGMLRQSARVAVSWSTVVLFGEVPRTREPHLLAMGVGCLVWPVAVVGVAFPPFAAFLFAFLPLPEPYEDIFAWYVMLAFAVIVPPLVTTAGLRTLDAEDRPRGPAALGAVLAKGYPYTACLSAILLGMAVLTVIRRARDRARHWTERHVPVIVQPDDYSDVLREIQQVLEQSGLAVRVERVAWVLRVSTRLLTVVAGPAVKDLLTERLSIVRSERVEVILHLSDLVIRGAEREVHRVRALLSEQLAFSKAYLTWDKQANEIEDRLRAIWRDAREEGEDKSVDAEILERLEAVDRELRGLDLSYEEWAVLSREKLLIERNLLLVTTGLMRRPKELTEVSPEERATEREHAANSSPVGVSG